MELRHKNFLPQSLKPMLLPVSSHCLCTRTTVMTSTANMKPPIIPHSLYFSPFPPPRLASCPLLSCIGSVLSKPVCSLWNPISTLSFHFPLSVSLLPSLASSCSSPWFCSSFRLSESSVFLPPRISFLNAMWFHFGSNFVSSMRNPSIQRKNVIDNS